MTLCLTFIGCANYRTNTSIEFDSTKVPKYDKSIPILADGLNGKDYSTIKSIEATISKLGLFHDRPTNEQANYVLRHIAKQNKADAIINVKYDYGIGAFSWGVLTATGTLIKYK
jgi:hypothetical protein